jgi:hypothetical protein
MAEIERIIIDARSDLHIQVEAAKAAIEAGIEEGGLFGMGKGGKFFGVRRNKTSIRVYPQEEQN